MVALYSPGSAFGLLSDEGLEDQLEGFNEVGSHVVLKVSAHDVIHGVY